MSNGTVQCCIKGDKFCVLVNVSETDSSWIVRFPTLFNFANTKSSYLKIKGIQSLCNLKNGTHNLSSNDMYLTSYDTGSIPNTLPLLGYKLKICSGKWKIGAILAGSDDFCPIPIGNHTINAQSVIIKKDKCSMNKCSNSKFQNHVFTQVVMDANFFELPGTEFSVNAKVRKNNKLTEVTVSSFSFTTTSATGPNDPNAGPAILLEDIVTLLLIR